jgi:hypothetical protein
MSVLSNLIEERERWANIRKEDQTHRNRMIVLEFGLMLTMGLLVTVYYHKILAALMLWFNF